MSKRTVEERATDTSFALALRAEGYGFREITDLVFEKHGRKLLHGQLKRDLDWYLESLAYQVEGRKDRERAMQVEKLNAIERSAWHGWRLSLEPEKYEEAFDQVSAGVDKSFTKRSSKNRTGDPRYLRMLIEVIEQRTALLGLAAPPGVYTDWVADVVAALRRGTLTVDMVKELYPESAESIIIRAGMTKATALPPTTLEGEVITNSDGEQVTELYDELDSDDAIRFVDLVAIA